MKFRKKPVVIEAEQFFPNQSPWPDGVLEEVRPADYESQRRGFDTVTRYVVKTLEGEHIASPGDWIITGVKGERYPCKPDIFAATYEAVIEDDL